MKNLPLETIDVRALDVVTPSLNVRKDLHAYVAYIRSREVKRAYRSNEIPKPDLRRLAKLMSDPDAAAHIKEFGESLWIDFIDDLALQLDFVDYDTEGEYIGYTSHSPSFRNNYISFQAKVYNKFSTLSMVEQEHWMLDKLVHSSSTEFFNTGPMGRLDGFSIYGSAMGVLPTLDFPDARWFLLDVLNNCQGGVWYSVASLVKYLKENHPYFLIPKKPKINTGRSWGKYATRYGNFHESKKYSQGNEIEIKENSPNAFERVEGRYVERFLENIPLTLQYTDVAYNEAKSGKLYPSLNELQAFRVNSRFLQVMRNQIAPPNITIQPNFEIYVESAFYPLHVFNQLSPLTNLISDDRVTILKLDRKKVAGQLAQDESLDVIALLKDLSSRDLPKNVRRELEEWAGHSDVFTLYNGFGLLEGDAKLPGIDEMVVEQISPKLRLIRSPQTVYARLEAAEQIPLAIYHSDDALRPMPEKTKTVFAKKSTLASKKKKKEEVVIKREVNIILQLPSLEVLDALRKILVRLRCSVSADKTNLTLTYSQKNQALAKQALKELGKEYRIKIQSH